jgi:hypothetical protein
MIVSTKQARALQLSTAMLIEKDLLLMLIEKTEPNWKVSLLMASRKNPCLRMHFSDFTGIVSGLCLCSKHSYGGFRRRSR